MLERTIILKSLSGDALVNTYVFFKLPYFTTDILFYTWRLKRLTVAAHTPQPCPNPLLPGATQGELYTLGACPICL